MSRRILSLVLLPMALLLASSSALSSTVIAAPEAMREPVGPPSFGINSHLATRYPDPTAMDV
ncbi:MAG: glycosyl hydrolase, partial [Chloroflexaceae bacterium]|nr:glycosyl hydrolase [Chloroflexaceae bacterium]